MGRVHLSSTQEYFQEIFRRAVSLDTGEAVWMNFMESGLKLNIHGFELAFLKAYFPSDTFDDYKVTKSTEVCLDCNQILNFILGIKPGETISLDFATDFPYSLRLICNTSNGQQYTFYLKAYQSTPTHSTSPEEPEFDYEWN